MDSAHVLYTDIFYSDVLRVLRPGGGFSQQMNIDNEEHKPAQIQYPKSWLKLGFADTMERREYIGSYGGIIVMMGGIKG